MNLQLHLERLSENPEDQNEWLFKDSRPIEPGESRVCPCGQTGISSYYTINNTKNGNETFVGSSCIANVHPDFGKVITYFERLLSDSTRGTYCGVDVAGLHQFQVRSNTTLVTGALDDVQKYNPPVVRNQDGKWCVKVDYSTGPSLTEGHEYLLWLKAKYEQGHLLFTVVRCDYSHPESSASAKQGCSVLQHHRS